MPAPELILTGGRVVTVDGRSTVAEAVAVREGRIVAVGDAAEVRALAGPSTRVIDLAGGSVLPGINDSHLHLQWYALARPPYALDLAAPGVRSLDELRGRVAQAAAERPAGTWIRGRGWRQEALAELRDGGRGPTAADLDAASPDHPVLLEHWSYHALWLNRRALQAAGITRATPDPDGGRIVRGADGEPTGELHEAAMELALRVVPERTPPERRDATAAATEHLNTLGVTSVTDPVVSPELLRDYLALRAEGRLGVRVSVLLYWDWPSTSTSAQRLRTALRYVGAGSGLGDEWLRVGGCKLFADGVPALGTAWMSKPYGDGWTGSLVTEGDSDVQRRAELAAMIELLHRHRFQVQVHATGDRACDAVADGFIAAMEADRWPAARHVIIHASFLSARTAARLARHGFVANVNSLIKWQAADTVRPLLDDARWHANMPVRSLLDAGLHVADSSDAPITVPDWRRALQTLVLRETGADAQVSGPDERVTREQAIRAWTIEPAYQEGLERTKGSIEVGKHADLVVLAEDVLAVDDHELHALTPIMTVLGGRVVHER